jgi:hypothetical protein
LQEARGVGRYWGGGKQARSPMIADNIVCLVWSPQRDELNLKSSSRGSNSCLRRWRRWVQAVGCPGNAVSGLHDHDFEFLMSREFSNALGGFRQHRRSWNQPRSGRTRLGRQAATSSGTATRAARTATCARRQSGRQAAVAADAEAQIRSLVVSDGETAMAVPDSEPASLWRSRVPGQHRHQRRYQLLREAALLRLAIP